MLNEEQRKKRIGEITDGEDGIDEERKAGKK